jgi:hypothetical protein
MVSDSPASAAVPAGSSPMPAMPAPGSTPAPASSEPAFDRAAEVFLALTTRWRTPRGALGIGVSQASLVEALGGEPELDQALGTLRGRLVGLGMELVEYRLEAQPWLCLRSVHVAPTELAEDQQGVLGVIIMLAEADDPDGDSGAAGTDASDGDIPASPRTRTKKSLDGDVPRVPTARLADILAPGGGSGYLSRNRLDDILRELEAAGYIGRRHRAVQYGARLLIEFPDDARTAIAEQASRLVT